MQLKKQIKSLKLNLTDHQVDQIKDEENQLSFLKKEYEKICLERQTLTKKRGEK